FSSGYSRVLMPPRTRICTIAKREEERCTLVHCRHNPDAAAVASNNAGDRSQTDAGTFKFGCFMQSLEWGEKRSGEFLIEAGSVVLHAKDSFVLVVRNKRDSGIRLFGCELPGVAQQVFQRDLNKAPVAGRREPFGDCHDHP